MNPIPTSSLQALIDLGSKATARPWEVLYLFGSSDLPMNIFSHEGEHGVPIVHFTEECSAQPTPDARFIAAAANAAVPLAQEVLKLREIVEVMEERLEIIVDLHEHNIETGKQDTASCCGMFDTAREALANVAEIRGGK